LFKLDNVFYRVVDPQSISFWILDNFRFELSNRRIKYFFAKKLTFFIVLIINYYVANIEKRSIRCLFATSTCFALKKRNEIKNVACKSPAEKRKKIKHVLFVLNNLDHTFLFFMA